MFMTPMAGGLVFVLLQWLRTAPVVNMLIAVALIITIRMLAVRKHWSLPVIR